MPRVDVEGVGIAYEIIGEGPRSAIITPGGRFSKDTPGVRALALKLAEGGFRTIIWDRPNCGESDVSLSGASESQMHADVMAQLLRTLDMAPAFVIGGSAGARVSLLVAVQHPDVVERLAVLWLCGGALCLAFLATYYCHDSMLAAAQGDMAAVTELPVWKEAIERNPRNREILLKQDTRAFIEKMKAWGAALAAPGDQLVPGFSASDLATLKKMPVMVYRGGESDVHHPRETSEALHRAIPGALLVEPPWGDREWLHRLRAEKEGEGFFQNWPLLAPQLLAFATSEGAG